MIKKNLVQLARPANKIITRAYSDAVELNKASTKYWLENRPQTRHKRAINDRKLYLNKQYAEHIERPLVMVYQHTHMNVSEYLNVKQIVNKHGFEIQTVRSTIMRTIISNTKFANMANLFHGPVLLVYQKDGNTDELNQNAAKLLTAMKKFKKLFLLGAKTEDQIYNPEGFIKFTELPPKEQLQAQILGTLQAPGSKILSILQQNPTLLAQLLSQHKDQLDGKKEE